MPSVSSLQPEHPRLMLTPARLRELREASADDPQRARLLRELRRSADWMLAEPVVRYERVGPRLLAQSRACLGRVSTLALAWRMFDDERCAARAWSELQAAAAFPDWNPSHFLDTAELGAAFALGYDWLHAWLGPERRRFLRETMITKGLQPGREQHARQVASRSNNWNPVCNGGLVLAALAIAEDEPGWAEEMLGLMQTSLARALQYYAPDGAWHEGPGYWKYGTTYLVMLLDSLQTALEDDGGWSWSVGLDRTGQFFCDTISPGGRMFNYADSGMYPGTSPALFWLAHRYEQPRLADVEHRLLSHFLELLATSRGDADSLAPAPAMRKNEVELTDLLCSNRFFALELVWYHPGSGGALSPASGVCYRGVVEVAVLRGRGDEQFFVGFKGAGVPNAHAHLDAGGFVLEAFGERWADDLGPEDYDLPGYWDMTEGGRRWDYFRLGSLSHNVVTINGANQRTPCRVPLTRFANEITTSSAVADLGEAYAGQAIACLRGVAIAPGFVHVQDEVTGLHDGDEARWALLTMAEIEIAGEVAWLRLNGKKLAVRLFSPAGATWQIEPATPPTSVENPNRGYRLLTARAALRRGEMTRFDVTFSAPGKNPFLLSSTPLAAWPNGSEPPSGS